jgi:serine/threonine protein kinase
MSGTSNEGEGGKAVRRRLRGKPFGIDERFESLGERPLGTGGKAQVWKARDTAARPFGVGPRQGDDDFRRTVAVKVLKDPADPDDRARLRGEGGPDRQAIQHANVVRTFALRGSEREPFLVLEYIPGKNCAQLFEQHGPFDPVRLVEIGVQLCRGLGAMHAADLLHRDVKPANVMIVGDLRGGDPIVVKLIDLGIAKAPDDPDHTREGRSVGTPAYASPEAVLGGATKVSDVYSVGAVLYELATGQRLTPLSWEEATRLRRAAALPTPQDLNPAVPEWLGWLIMDAIALDPERRPESAAALEDALQADTADASEVATRLMGGPHEAPTNVLPWVEDAGAEVPADPPWVYRVLPDWIKERVPDPPKKGTEGHWYIFLLALCAGPVLLTSLLLAFAIWVLAPIFALPPLLVLTALALGSGIGWVLWDGDRRAAAGHGLRTAADAARRGALWAWYWAAEQIQQIRPAAPPAAERPEEHADSGRRHAPAARARRAGHGTRRRGRAPGRAAISSLHRARTRLAGARDVAAPWVPWFGRQFFVALVAALAACIVLWLLPPLQDRVDTRPEGHQTLLTAVPLLVFGAVAGFGLYLLQRSRARPRRLLAGGLVLLVLLTAIGMAMPTSTGWLEPTFWPEDSEAQEREQAELREERAARERQRAEALAAARAAHSQSDGLRDQVRAVEKRWVRLLRNLRKQGWEFNPEMTEVVRDKSDALAAQLTGWTRISRYVPVRNRARQWLVSLRRAASEVKTRECTRLSVDWPGARAECS